MAAAASAARVRFSYASSSCSAGVAVAVQRVVGAYAQRGPDADGHGDVVAELARPGRDGEHTTVRARQVPSEEVHTDEVYSGVTNGRKEGVDLTVGRHRLVRPGPPELNGRKASGPGSRGPSQQRHLGEQQRAVGGKDELTSHWGSVL